MRKIYYWKLAGAELQLGERTLIMGILNVTPDSFHDGGRFSDPDRAYARALEMEEQGADIIDIGAESTRPGSHRITADEEWQRLVPVLKRLRGNLSVPLSLDTYKSEIAERALEYGIAILNDPSGLTFDADLAKIAARGNAGLILNHMRGTPETWAKLPPLPDVAGSISRDLEATTNRARRAGVEKNRIAIDPGLGFGKRREQNSDILAHLGRLAALEYPIVAGASHKSFLPKAEDVELVHATAAAVTAAILNGAHIVRVHDVKEMRIVAQVADEIARAAAVAPAHELSDRQPAQSRRQEGAAQRPPRRAFEQEERAKPTRPPLAPRESLKPAAKPAVPEEAPAVEKRPAVRPPQDRPSKGWAPPARKGPIDRRQPDRFREDRPGPVRHDRPGPVRHDRPGPNGRKDDRTSREPWKNRPDRRPENRGPSGERPPRREPQNRPPQDRPPRGPSNRGPKTGPPRRPFRKRP